MLTKIKSADTTRSIVAIAALLILFVFIISFVRSMQPADAPRDRDAAAVLEVDYDFDEVAPSVVRRMMLKDAGAVTLVDLRPVGAFATHHIPGSISLPYDTLMETDPAPSYATELVVVVFRNMNAQKLSAAVRKLAQTNNRVVVLSGGIDAWTATGAPMVTDANPNDITNAAKILFISMEDVAALIAQARKNPTDVRSFVIVDTRPRDTFAAGHIPLARNIPFEVIADTADVSRAKTLIVYGETVRDSMRAAIRFTDVGFPFVKTLRGGYIDWVRANRPTVFGGSEENTRE